MSQTEATDPTTAEEIAEYYEDLYNDIEYAHASDDGTKITFKSATGSVGSHWAKEMLEKGFAVYAVGSSAVEFKRITGVSFDE